MQEEQNTFRLSVRFFSEGICSLNLARAMDYIHDFCALQFREEDRKDFHSVYTHKNHIHSTTLYANAAVLSANKTKGCCWPGSREAVLPSSHIQQK